MEMEMTMELEHKIQEITLSNETKLQKRELDYITQKYKTEDDICTDEDDLAIVNGLARWRERDIGPDEIYTNGSQLLSFQGIFPIKNMKIGSVYINRLPQENINVYKNTFNYFISTGKIEWFKCEQSDPEKAYEEYCEIK